MNVKYYFDNKPFGYNNNKHRWKCITSYISFHADFIEIIEEITLPYSDSVCRKKIKDLLENKIHHFKSQKPIDKTVSLSPFLNKNDYNSVCFKYKITKEIVNELKKEWLEELKSTLVIAPFIVFKQNMPILWVNIHGTVALLNFNEYLVWGKCGFKLKEYDITLNDAFYMLNRIDGKLNCEKGKTYKKK